MFTRFKTCYSELVFQDAGLLASCKQRSFLSMFGIVVHPEMGKIWIFTHLRTMLNYKSKNNRQIIWLISTSVLAILSFTSDDM
jgi:hypothetical protein